MAADMSRDQEPLRGEPLNDGIAGARLLLLPGRGHLTALYDPRLKPAIERCLGSPG